MNSMLTMLEISLSCCRKVNAGPELVRYGSFFGFGSSGRLRQR